MGKGQVDSTLVIRARDEASKAVSAIEAALKELASTQGQVATGSQNAASGFAQTLSALAGLDRAYSQIAGAADKGSVAFDRQGAALEGNRAQFRALQSQLESARSAQERMNAAIGPRSQEATSRYAAIALEIANLEAQSKRLQSTIAQQESGFSRSASSLAELERQTKLVGAVTTFAKAQSEQYAASLQKQNAAAERTAVIQTAIARGTDSTVGKSAAASADVFRSAGKTAFEKHQAAAAEELAAKATLLRAELNPLAMIQEKLNRELAELPSVARAAGLSVGELAQAEALLRKRADDATRAVQRRQRSGQGGLALLGLQPHELQILGYQVNDIITQLASGTSLTQTLAQQGGQILQIFPRAGSAILRAFSNPAVLAFAATTGVIVTALKEAGDEADRLRGFIGLLAATANGNTYGAAELNAAANALDAYGLSAKDAVDAVRAFMRQGIDERRIEEFGTAAADLADVMGVDLKEAVKQVAEAFSSGYESVKKLDDAYEFLTASQREQIRTLFEEGRAGEARNLALNIFHSRMGDAAEQMRGPWSDAARELGGAWQAFTHWLAQTGPIEEASNALSELGNIVARTIRVMRGTSSEADKLQQIAEQEALIADLHRTGAGKPQLENAAAYLKELRQQLSVLRETNKAEQGRGDTIAQNTELGRKQTAALKEATLSAKERKTVAEAEVEARRKAAELVNSEFRFADQATKLAYIAQEVAKAREATQKRIADAAKREADERKRAADEAKRLAQQSQFIDPVSGPVTSGFGARKAPTKGASTFHRGLDFAVPLGTDVKAPASGVVIETGFDAKLGKFLFIDHGNNTVSKFGHLSDNAIVSPGQLVSPGQRVARSGNSGNSTGPHLHYQVEVNGKAVDPRTGVFLEDGPGRFKIDLSDAVSEYDKIVEKQEEFLSGLDLASQARQRDTAQLREQATLSGAALLDAQNLAIIEDAIAKVRSDASKLGIGAGDPALELRIQKLRETMGAYNEAAHARDKFENQRAAVDKPVQDLSALRQSLTQRFQFLQESGQTGLANQLLPQLDNVNAKLLDAIANARAFYSSLAINPEAMAALRLTTEEIETIKLSLDATSKTAQTFAYVLGIAGEQIAQVFASQAAGALDRFSQAVAQGSNVFKSLGQAFRQFASDFLRQIAQMIRQQLVFNMVASIFSTLGGGGIAGGGGKALPSSSGAILKAHSGGVVGDPSTYGRNTGMIIGDMSWFRSAHRYHTGGIAGLAADEVSAVLKRGEEVLTEDDPRHRYNGGGRAAQPRINVINTIDPTEFLSKALGTRQGDETILNWMRANRSSIKQSLG